MKFSSFLDRDFINLVESKIKESISNKDVTSYKEILIARGADLSYTLSARGMDTPSDSIEDIVDAAIDVISAEVDGIVSTVVSGTKPGTIKEFKRGKAINVTKSRSAFRGANGRFIGALKLASLLNSVVKIKATEIMKNNSHGNTLNFRTGRLANSVNLTTVNLERGSIYFNYMYAPYSVFEKGGKQHKKGRDPRDIFSHALAEALTQLISNKDLAQSKFKVYAGRDRQGTIVGGRFQ